MKNFSFKNLFAKRSFKYGAASTSYVVVVIAAVVVLNVIFSILAQRLPLKADLTPENFYNLSDSKDFIKAVNQTVDITILMPEEQFKSNYGEQGSMTVELIKKYCVLNPRIKFHSIDIYVNPKLKEKYKDANLTQSSIIVESAKRYKVLDNSDLFLTETGEDGSTYVQGFKGEQKITSAINFVVSDSVPSMIFTNNHEEESLQGITEIAEDNNFQVLGTDLGINDIPENTTIITIVNPKRDFTVDEIDKLDRFADRGNVGFVVFLDPQVSKSAIPNFTSFLQEWKITPNDDIIMDDQYYWQNDFSYLIPERAANNDITKGIDANVKAIMPVSKSLTINTDLSNLFNVYSFMSTQSTAYQKASNASSAAKTKDDVSGTFDVAAASVKGIEGTSYQSKMVVFGSTFFASDYLTSLNSYANGQIILNSFNFIRGSEDLLQILPKYYEDYSLTITNVEAGFFGMLFVIIIPAILLILGFVVFLRRRHL